MTKKASTLKQTKAMNPDQKKILEYLEKYPGNWKSADAIVKNTNLRDAGSELNELKKEGLIKELRINSARSVYTVADKKIEQ